MKSMVENAKNSYLFGSNAGFIEELYDRYLLAKETLDPKWIKYFDSLQDGKNQDVSHEAVKEKFVFFTQNPNTAIPQTGEINLSQLKVFELIDNYRNRGVFYADLDPLQRKSIKKDDSFDLAKLGIAGEINSEFYVDFNLNNKARLKDIINNLDAIYCNKLGFEFSHITNQVEKDWLTNYVENNYLNYKLGSAEKIQILQKLTEAEGLERYLHTKYVGAKRFSLEGGESLIPGLDRVIRTGAKNGINQVFIGMAHRGRLNTLVNIAGKSPKKLFDEFDGNYPSYDFVTSGDVKYHKGYKCNYVVEDKKVKVTLAFNPSHLEVVNPILSGMVRATQDNSGEKSSILGVLIHGDAALIGLGTNQGILNMSQTRAYSVGGMLHIVVNNQVGFTTSDIRDNRSSRYCTDIAKMIDAPVIHVNGDDPESLLFAIDLAIKYHNQFKKDIMIDLVCFRRYGHNETDDPTLTQPLMYGKVKSHSGVRTLYADKLVNEGITSKEEVNKLFEDYREGLTHGKHIKEDQLEALKWYDNFDIKPVLSAKSMDKVNTIIDKEQIIKITQAVTELPNGFNPHPTLRKLLETRKSMGEGAQPIDFGMAETLAYGSLLANGINVRITGEDTGRGTFSHRMAVWHDINRDDLADSGYTSLTRLENNSKFSIYDSVLNEECVLGFEYGYSTVNLRDLVIWEAQFGDFANGAQVIIDQFIASGEAKWGTLANVSLLLPHGYDGQGPEHSSARLERFLQLCAENNMQIVLPSTAAQMFHLLRHKALTNWIKPLVIFMSKKLLRYKEAMSSINDFTNGGFKTIIEDKSAKPKSTERVLVCSGQVYYDLIQEREKRGLTDNIAIIRIEQLYPFPLDTLHAELSKYSKAQKFIWVQEEPYNQGAWIQIRDALDNALGHNSLHKFGVVSRPAAAAPACGIPNIHNEQLKQLILDAFE